MMRGIFRFFESGVHCDEQGWLFSIPSNNEYAHAPWWTYNIDANSFESTGVTAEIAGFLLVHSEKNTALYKKALRLAELMLDKLKTPGKYGDMGVGGYCILLENIQQAGLTGHFNYPYITQSVTKLVNQSIERDSAKWASYSVRPSQYINSPTSRYYQDNQDIVSKELDYLIETRRKEGVWDITWSWFDNNEKYAREFAISENWWKASRAIQTLKLLKTFGRAD
jgi:hypothetical protein